MTIDEAIKHCEEKTKELREQPLKEKMNIEDIAVCEECAEEHEQLAEWLKELKRCKEQGEGCISRQAVLDICDKYNGQGYVWTVIRGEVEQLPPVTPQPRMGHWIYSKAVNTSEIIWSECSECKDGERGCAKRMKYCPNCGAKMLEVEE